VAAAKRLVRIRNRIIIPFMKARNVLGFIVAAAVARPSALPVIDTDAHGLDDSVETNTGVYLSPANRLATKNRH
jgi:hypothetical protein